MYLNMSTMNKQIYKSIKKENQKIKQPIIYLI